MKRLYIKDLAKMVGLGYDTLWLAIKSGKVPDHLIQKEFSDVGKYERRFFYADDVPDIKLALEQRSPGRVKIIKPTSRHEIAKKAAKARWDKVKTVTRGRPKKVETEEREIAQFKIMTNVEPDDITHELELLQKALDAFKQMEASARQRNLDWLASKFQ